VNLYQQAWSELHLLVGLQTLAHKALPLVALERLGRRIGAAGVGAGELSADVTRFCFITGWRSKSEAFPLRWAQVDWSGGFVRLEPGQAKDRDGRAFPITPALRQVLTRRLEETRRVEAGAVAGRALRVPPEGPAASLHVEVLAHGL